VVWADIEEFLRNPGEVLETLAQKIEGLEDGKAGLKRDIKLLDTQLTAKGTERDRILTLYRRGTIGADLLDRQMAEVEKERGELTEALKQAREGLAGLTTAMSAVDSADSLLRELNGRLDGPLTFELKREIVEALVEGIVVETIEEDGRKQAVVHVMYKCDNQQSHIGTRTDTGSSQQ
jgi:multidrug resistance efflux pump